MGGCQHLLGVMALALIIVRGTVVAGNSGQGLSIQVKHERSSISLVCKASDGDSVLGWRKDGRDISGVNGSKLPVGLAADDPRGLYQCFSKNANASLQLYFQMCQYCVRLNLAMLMGIVGADLVAVAFLAGAVWWLATQERSRLSRASDKQTLLAHDQLYQPLEEHSNGQYSHIGVAKARRR